MKKLLSISFLLGLVFLAWAKVSVTGDAILGTWKTTDGSAHIEMYKNGNKYQGKIIWLKVPIDPETGKPKLDKKHPDPASQSRPIMGLVNIWGFSFDGEKMWKGGKIYDPKSGKTYDCQITMEGDNTLKVRGYIGVSLIGRTETWTRLK